MPLVISDATLAAAGLDAKQAALEIACRWFDAGLLSFGRAAELAGVDAAGFEQALAQRHIPRQRYTVETLESDVFVLKRLGRW